ncbi:MAG: mannose-6-phosphate isomerase, class I [Desulfobacterales bacterium]|jgi:mannose-6-phosphate isomerase|nr:mannose-6-phosphate isomerase, class I [Desulfobacterales bacterium]
MNSICILENPIQEYAWGSRTAIADLLGKSPSQTPQAELWMGAHSKSPSLVPYKGRKIPLTDLIDRYPVEILGAYAATKFNGKLPYLFKVLAAAEPLSIQAHPNAAQAISGFDRENRMGIALTAPERNYRDTNHKPECICALTPFWALRGFRRMADMLFHLRRICPKTLGADLALLDRTRNPAGLKRFFETLMTLNETKKQRVISEAVFNAQPLGATAPCYQWIITLHRAYSSDIGILSPVMLNLVCLKPGEAMFLEAGELHAYLEGLGMELMANSDNVLRGGLTPKHVNVPELLQVLNFEEREIDILSPKEIRPCERRYPCPAEEFALSVIILSGGADYKSESTRGVEILFCTEGQAHMTNAGKNESLTVKRGMALLVPAAVFAYTLKGDATLYKATVPTA